MNIKIRILSFILASLVVLPCASSVKLPASALTAENATVEKAGASSGTCGDSPFFYLIFYGILDSQWLHYLAFITYSRHTKRQVCISRLALKNVVFLLYFHPFAEIDAFFLCAVFVLLLIRLMYMTVKMPFNRVAVYVLSYTNKSAVCRIIIKAIK